MPKQGTQSHGAYPEHVEQVRQPNEAKGSLVFATGKDWCGKDATDGKVIQAGPHSWFDAVMLR